MVIIIIKVFSALCRRAMFTFLFVHLISLCCSSWTCDESVKEIIDLCTMARPFLI